MNRAACNLESANVSKLLFTYSFPAIIASVASALYNIIDRIIIGNGVGAYAISGLALTFPIMNLGSAFGTLIGAGAASIVSIRLGEKNCREAEYTLGNALIISVLIGLLYSIVMLCGLEQILLLFGAGGRTLPYARDFMRVILVGDIITQLFFCLNGIMRASGYPIKAMITVLITVLVNLLLAPLFVFCFGWGIRGAAWATLLAQLVGLFWIFGHFCRENVSVRLTCGCLRINRNIIEKIVSIGFSPFLIHFCSGLIVILINWQLKKQGGDMAVGAFGVINALAGVVIMVILGLSQGMQPIVGYNFGAMQKNRVRQTFRQTVIWASVVATMGWLCFMIFPVAIAKLFSDDWSLVDNIVFGMRIYFLVLPLIGFQIVASYFFQSIGKAKISILLSLLRQVLFLIPLLLLMPAWFGFSGVWAAQPLADILSAVCTLGVLTFAFRSCSSPLSNK